VLRDGVGADPADEHEQGAQRPRLGLQRDVVQGVDGGGDEAVVEHHVLVVGQGGHERQLRRQGLGVGEQNQGREKNRPHEDEVDEDVDLVAVVRAVECELLLQVEDAAPRHGCRDRALPRPGSNSSTACRLIEPEASTRKAGRGVD
jgi:hypothetical protein